MAWNPEESMVYYKRMGAPSDQSVLIALLREVQQESGGGIPVYALRQIAAFYQIRESLILALIRRIPSLRLSDSHLLELCAGPNCGKHAALAAAAEKMAGKNLTVKFTPCMRMCGRGPNVRLDGKLYHGMSEAALKQLLADLPQG